LNFLSFAGRRPIRRTLGLKRDDTVNGFRIEFRSGTEGDSWNKYKNQISANIRDASVPGLPLVITAVMLARMLKRAEWITSANVVILNAREIVGVFVG